ncbi:DUF4440 domain-containing protein [Altererythrobacter xixiisoli]|uniref:DUF4440 domain-containing protein n=1 Tax=Croceibacterium xixiisoli TaxID=1476466 RepID=A0A6I4TWE4_9SPHN|nr:nuclear transport factor 2 family protein [Croceibacterium xixiisoli]MXP00173.1 DUF4440 domain-containing protein [Croceibacterium xixiisoli]
MKIRAAIVAVTPLLLLAACGTAGDPQSNLSAVELTAQAQIEAIAAKDIDGVMRLFDETAVMTGPNREVLTGPAAVRAGYEKLLGDPNLSISVTPGPGWAASSGDLAVTTSDANLTTTDSTTGQAVTIPLRNQTVWHKATGSTWKIVSAHIARVETPGANPAG